MRKKEKLLLILLTITFNCIGQNYHPLTLISKGFTILNSSNTKEIKSNKTIILTYNSGYSSLYIEGEGSHSFPNERYSEEATSDGFMESYLSAETNTSMFGFWHIMVFKMKERTDFEISFRNGITYYAKNAKLYSEDGQIKHNPYIKNWKENVEKEEKTKTLKLHEEKIIKDSIGKEKVRDSIQLIRQDSLNKVIIENELLSGNNFNYISRNVEDSLNSIVQNRVALKESEFIYTSWIIRIDVNGFIIDAHPDETDHGGYIIKSYIPIINEAFINQKIKPFISKKGKKYPSYSKVYINLNHVVKKEKKHLNLIKMLPLGSFIH